MKQIKTEAEYQAALKEIESLMMADPDKTPTEGEKLDVMVTLVEAYEARLARRSGSSEAKHSPKENEPYGLPQPDKLKNETNKESV